VNVKGEKEDEQMEEEDDDCGLCRHDLMGRMIVVVILFDACNCCFGM